MYHGFEIKEEWSSFTGGRFDVGLKLDRSGFENRSTYQIV